MLLGGFKIDVRIFGSLKVYFVRSVIAGCLKQRILEWQCRLLDLLVML